MVRYLRMEEVNLNKMGRQTRKNLILLASVTLTLIGLLWTIPLVLQNKYLWAIIPTLSLIAGMILMAIVFGD